MTRQYNKSKYNWENLMKGIPGATLRDKFLYLKNSTMKYEDIAILFNVPTSTIKTKILQMCPAEETVTERWNRILKDYPGECLKDRFDKCIRKFEGNLQAAAESVGVSRSRFRHMCVSLTVINPTKCNRKMIVNKKGVKIFVKDNQQYNYKLEMEKFFSQYGNVQEIQTYLRNNPVRTYDELVRVLVQIKKKGESPSLIEKGAKRPKN
jgi:hypothetical protein